MRKTLLIISIFVFGLSLTTLALILNKEDECANSITCIQELTTVIEEDAVATYMGKTISVPNIDLEADTASSIILGDNTEIDQVEKHIYVDLENQTLYTYEDDEMIFETLVSTGRWGWTPTGTFKIWIKIRSTTMSGGEGATYYNLPNVPFVMFFYNSEIPRSRGYGFHGTYWHNNFGHTMSHGCVNLRNIDAEILYNWASPTSVKSTTHATTDDPGTELTICKELEIQEGTKPVCLN